MFGLAMDHNYHVTERSFNVDDLPTADVSERPVWARGRPERCFRNVARNTDRSAKESPRQVGCSKVNSADQRELEVNSSQLKARKVNPTKVGRAKV